MKGKRLARVVVSLMDQNGAVIDQRDARIRDNKGAWITPKNVKRQMRRIHKKSDPAFADAGFKRKNVWVDVSIMDYQAV